MDAPPLFQEMIVGETTTIIEERIRGEIYQSTTAEVSKEIEQRVTKRVVRLTSQLFTDLIPEIVKDIVKSTVTGGPRINFRDLYHDSVPEVIEMAIEAAETIAGSCVLARLETGQESWDIEYD